jgi:hypothetical protein
MGDHRVHKRPPLETVESRLHHHILFMYSDGVFPSNFPIRIFVGINQILANITALFHLPLFKSLNDITLRIKMLKLMIV